MGIADALVLSTNNGIVCLAFGEQKAAYLGVMLGGAGLGAIIGPVIGSVVYGIGGYAFTFYFFAGVITINLTLNTLLVPSVLNHNRLVTGMMDRKEKLQAHLSAQMGNVES